jgi:signal transduction histidine kinase
VIAAHAAIDINNARLFKTRQQALEKVRNMNEIKNNFLALASHELRTPLGIIIGYSTFLQSNSHGESNEHAGHVLTAASQMRSLLDQMNNLTMLQMDEMILRKMELPVQDILNFALDEIKYTAARRDLQLVLAFREDPIPVNVDPEKTTLSIVNLLNNAIRFSPEGTNITIGALEEKGDVIAWVQDSGIGIPKSELNKIFEEFYQVERPNTRRFGGLGLGLAIARGLIEDQGGKLWAESEGAGKGATFKVRLPAALS